MPLWFWWEDSAAYLLEGGCPRLWVRAALPRQGEPRVATGPEADVDGVGEIFVEFLFI